MATQNEKLQNEILGSYLMSNSKSPRTAKSKQERFSGIIGNEREDEIPAENLSGSTNTDTGSYEQTIIRSPTAKPISLKDWLILSGLIHELDYSDTSALDSYASWSEEAPKEENLNKGPTRGSGTFPERTSKPEVLKNDVAKGNFLTNDDINLLNEAIREYVSSNMTSEPKTKNAQKYLKPLNELKAFLFTQNGVDTGSSSSSSGASFQDEIHQNNSSEIRSSSDIKNELIINQNAPFTGLQTPPTSKNKKSEFSTEQIHKNLESQSTGILSEIKAKKQSTLESNWQKKGQSIEKSKSSDLLPATESISENVVMDQIKSISSNHVTNEEAVQNEEQIGNLNVLKSENKLASSGVLQTKTDVISSDWEHPVLSHQALEPVEIPAQQFENEVEFENGGELRIGIGSQVSSEDELLDLSRLNSQRLSESTHALLELESMAEAQLVNISGSTMLNESADDETNSLASKQQSSQEQELINALQSHVSHVQQHSLSSISPEIDRTLNKENDVNAFPENDTYSHSAANQTLPKEESKPELSKTISGNNYYSQSSAEKQEERKSAKSYSELVENLTSDGKSGAYAGYDIAVLNDLRLPELLDALRTGGAYSVNNKDSVKGQLASSATAKSDIPSSSSSKIAPSASVLNPLKEHISKIQKNDADKRNQQLIEAPSSPELMQLNSPDRQIAENSESKYEAQLMSTLLGLGAEEAPQHATMMSTSVNIQRVEDEYGHPLSSQTDGGVQNRVEGPQPVEQNTLSSYNILETNFEQTMKTSSEAKNSVSRKLPNSPSQETMSENFKNRNLEETRSNKSPSVAVKSDDFAISISEKYENPATESFKISTTQKSNLNQAGTDFVGSSNSKQNVLESGEFNPDDIIAGDISTYTVNLGRIDSSYAKQQIASVNRQFVIGINPLGEDFGSSVSSNDLDKSSIENSAVSETGGNSQNAASHASSSVDDLPQPSVADKLSSISPSFTAADAESTSAKSQSDKLTSTNWQTVSETNRDTVVGDPQASATVIRADKEEAYNYQGSTSTSITDSERSQNSQVNKGENPVKLIQMNENWMESSNPQITYQAASNAPPMHITQNVESASEHLNEINYARDFENHEFNSPNQKAIIFKNKDSQFQKPDSAANSFIRSNDQEKTLGDEIKREETVIDEMRPSLSASSDTIISENYPQKPKPTPLVHNVNDGFKDAASGVKTPFQIFPDELVASNLPSSSFENNLNPEKEAQQKNPLSPSLPDKLAESFSRDVFGAQVAKGSQSSQVTSALFCQSLGICNKENGAQAEDIVKKPERQNGMRPWSGIDDCTPQCSVVGGKTICSYRNGLI
ncbi:unnamed protein product [Oikopleura dioica]|uniref:Uncharacterized protein n=1 Tax=Oikopleura dioica TaxID=34765 RepID=E4YE34_OIKDI|nr:unnamed protein product [Oikopleura dioica]